MSDGKMHDKVVVITGGNTGIGKETAVELARARARVVITSRNEQRGEAALADIRGRSASDAVDVMPLDLASFRSIRSFASDLLGRYERLDVLVNNAGGIHSHRTETEDGFETTFGVNHLGHFLLTDLLMDRLREGAPARVVNVASYSHKSARKGLDFDDLQSKRGYRAYAVYAKSKLANIFFTRELARRLNGTQVTVNALHPGFVRSEFGRGGDTGPLYSAGMRVGSLFAISPEAGARTSVYLASSPEVADLTGLYFYKCRPVQPSNAALDDNAAQRLWSASEELVAAVSA